MRKQLGFASFARRRISPVTNAGRPLLAALMVAVAGVPATALPSTDITPTTAAAEQPALWVLSDSDTTVYLFGTFHALDERTDWFARDVRAAFDSADELVLETLVPTTPAELHGALARNAMAGPATVGAPVAGGTGTSSFTATAGQAISAGKSVGLSVDHGADAVLRNVAVREGKPVGGLESFDQQLAMFAALPPVRHKPRSAAVGPAADVRRMLLDMRAAWRRGDGTRFATVLGDLEAQSPTTYQRLFVDRNNHWARWIAGRMTRPGTVFVAVGTGHLIGRDSVQQKLSRHGFVATRIH